MNQQAQFILEYCKFNSTFCLLAISACTWLFAKEIENSGSLKWYHSLLALGFVTASLSAYSLLEVFKFAHAELSKTPIEQNLLSSEIKSALSNNLFYLYLTLPVLGSFVIAQSLLGKRIAVLTAFVLLPAFLLFTHDVHSQEASDRQINWVGPSAHPVYKAFLAQHLDTMASEFTRADKVNLRPSTSASAMEVFNDSKGQWYPINFPPNAGEWVAVSPNARAIQRAYDAAACGDPIKLIISLKNSTPAADLFVDNESWGKTNEFGSIKASLGTKCKGQLVDVDLKKLKCKPFSSRFTIKNDPEVYDKPIKLKKCS